MKIAIVLSLLALYASGAFARFDYYSVTHSDPPAKCQYEIVVKTASIDNAGTDAQITVALSGADGSNKRLEVWFLSPRLGLRAGPCNVFVLLSVPSTMFSLFGVMPVPFQLVS